MSDFIASLTKRLRALLDKSAWLLIVPALMAALVIDTPLAKTFMEWVVFGIPVAGLAIILSRIVFPQIDLTRCVELALSERHTPAAMIVCAIIFFVAVLVLALVLWVRT